MSSMDYNIIENDTPNVDRLQQVKEEEKGSSYDVGISVPTLVPTTPTPESTPLNTVIKYNLVNLYLLAISANLGSLLFGFDFGSVSWFLTSCLKVYDSDDNSVKYDYLRLIADPSNNGLYGFIAAGSSIGAFITYIFLLFYGNNIDKRDELSLSSLFYFIGALFESESSSATWHESGGISLFIIGRLMYGAGIALSFHAAPQYVSEHSPPKYRGKFGAATEAMIVTGVFISYLVGYLSDGDIFGWKIPFRIAYCLAILMGVLLLYLPQSLSWMTRNEMPNKDILDAFRFVNPNTTEDDVLIYLKSFEDEKKLKSKWDNSWKNRSNAVNATFLTHLFNKLPTEIKLLLSDRTLSRCLILSVALVLLQISSGQGSILYFAGNLFYDLCPNNPNDCILGLGIIKIIPVYAMLYVADSLGRRVYIIYGSSLMLLGFIIACFGIGMNHVTTSLIGLYAATVGYEISFGIMLWILINEIFPQFVRSAANSISISILFAWSTVVTFMLPYLINDIDYIGLFIIFTIISAIAVIVFVLFVPETRGTALEKAYKLVDEKFTNNLRAFGCFDTTKENMFDGDDDDDDDDDGSDEPSDANETSRLL